MTITCMNCGMGFNELIRISPDKYKCPLCGYRYIDMDVVNGVMGLDRYVTKTQGGLITTNEYIDIADYDNMDGSVVCLEGRVASSGDYYTLRIDDTKGLHEVEITRTEAMILIDELTAFIE